jgi:Flp pilus assembly protein TadG
MRGVRHRRVSRSRQRCQRGSITVQFALVFPVIVGILFAIIDAGRFVGARVMLTQAVTEGVRVASLSTTTTTATVDAAVQGAGSMLNGMTITTTCYVGSTAVTRPLFSSKVAGDRIEVRATYVFDPMFFSAFAKTLTQSSWTVLEW